MSEDRAQAIVKRGNPMEIIRVGLRARRLADEGIYCECETPILCGRDLMCGRCLKENQGQIATPSTGGGGMSLVGFKARNHRQQVEAGGSRPEVDDRALPPEDFAPLHERFRFTVDAAASAENAKLPRFWTRDQDALSQDWSGERVYCNPPFSSIEPWVEKAHTGGADLVVMLLPANRTEQIFWQRSIEPYRRAGELTVEFLPGRLRFLKPGQETIKANERPPFGCCLVIWTSEQTNRPVAAPSLFEAALATPIEGDG